MMTPDHLLTVERVAREHHDLVAALLYRYLSELGASTDYPYLHLYWQEAGRTPYLFRVGDNVAGFALVRNIERGLHEIAEFWVEPRHRRRGAGGRPPWRSSKRIQASGLSQAILAMLEPSCFGVTPLRGFVLTLRLPTIVAHPCIVFGLQQMLVTLCCESRLRRPLSANVKRHTIQHHIPFAILCLNSSTVTTYR